jgi:hypothetical protein
MPNLVRRGEVVGLIPSSGFGVLRFRNHCGRERTDGVVPPNSTSRVR